MEFAIPPAERPVEEIESLCMNCHENGTTKLLLTRIPFFKEIVLTSFDCPHCSFRNSEIQSAGEIQQRGVKYTFKLNSLSDLQRQVVKGDNCIVRVEELDLEVPRGRGQLTNLEGLVSMVKADLESGQDVRRQADERVYQAVQGVIDGIAGMLIGEKLPVTMTFDDPSGNSSVEPSPDDSGGKYVRHEYSRTPGQNEELGLGEQGAQLEDQPPQTSSTEAPPSSLRPEYSAAASMYPAPPQSNGHMPNTIDQDDDDEIMENKVYEFPTACPGCTKPSTTNMKMVRIPHFSDVVIMSLNCQHCGYRTNEVKSGGAIGEKGRVIKLKVKNKEDLSRDILKSESCALSVPELSLNVEPGTLGGRFTTVEGLLSQVRDDLKASIFDAEGTGTGSDASAGAAANTKVVTMPKGGDSMPTSARSRWEAFFGKLDSAIWGKNEVLPFTVEMKDPLAASYVQSFKAPDPDENIEVIDYERTEEEEEDLGLKDMKTEGYEGEPDQSVQSTTPAISNGAPSASDAAAEGNVDVDEIQQAVQQRMKELADT